MGKSAYFPLQHNTHCLKSAHAQYEPRLNWLRVPGFQEIEQIELAAYVLKLTPLVLGHTLTGKVFHCKYHTLFKEVLAVDWVKGVKREGE